MKGFEFLPVSREEMRDREWYYYDFLVVMADAYIDHPSFGSTLIARMLEGEGYRVAVLAQPDWHSAEAFAAMGRPRWGVFIGGGNLDSMVAHYTVAKRRREKDLYSPGGKMGLRPDRPTIVYANRAREAFGPDMPIVIGGLEASLRRFAHYDYWDDKVRRSILFDAPADLLVYGMGETATRQIARRLSRKEKVDTIRDVCGTAYLAREDEAASYHPVECPSYEEVAADRTAYARATRMQYVENDPIRGRAVVQRCQGRMLVANPPARPLAREELDKLYDLPFTREVHPMYQEDVPAIEEVRFSIAHNRGCFGGGNFCALTFHQGRMVTSRSIESVVREAEQIVADPRFKGYIHDVGGPTANFRHLACAGQKKRGCCPNRSCLAPEPCPNLDADHSEYTQLLRRLRQIPGVKKVFVRSGIRFDYVMADTDDTFMEELCKYHISGQLRVAPEHITDNVLRLMGKPENSVYEAFLKKYSAINSRLGKEQYAIPYLMSSHPGSTLDDAIALAEYIRDLGYMPEQVQDFYPTPSTISTCMYYTGLDPATLKPVYVTTNPHEKAMQRALIQYRNPKNYDLVHEALVKAGREDLIGFDKKCLIKPRKMHADGGWDKNRTGSGKNSNSSYGGKNTGVRKNLKNATERGKNGSGNNTAGTAHKKKTIRNVHKKKR